MSTEEQAAMLMRDYAVTFGSPAGQRVLADLEVYCRAIETTADDGISDRRMFMNEGRREVVLRIMKFAKMTINDIYQLRLGRPVLRTTEGERINE